MNELNAKFQGIYQSIEAHGFFCFPAGGFEFRLFVLVGFGFGLGGFGLGLLP